jgi:hypothetical protein
MSFESIPVTSAETSETSYIDVVQKHQIEVGILESGEDMPQSRVDTLLSQKALEKTTAAPGIEVTQAGSDLLAGLTKSESEASSDALEIDAARRQIDMASLRTKQSLQEKAIKLDWPQDKYEAELQKIETN